MTVKIDYFFSIEIDLNDFCILCILIIFVFCKLDESKPPKMKLECMGEYRFQGTVMAMESMPLSLARDALLLCFEDAKLSIVEYDPETHDLRTISLHYFETEDLHVCYSLFGLVFNCFYLFTL